ncbi:DUF2635 domain-containing protein [Cupriavidus sp. 2TAF22]|uniref:DUF2635 domain-containing protein n=1 Tax=unclassified Cupriavidus TaxID=2640874 RepID=UPI003F927892
MNADRKTVHVTPAEGRVVPDPQYRDNLPPEGRAVVRTPYWVRRINDGDVTIEGEPGAAVESVAEVQGQASEAEVAPAGKTGKGGK